MCNVWFSACTNASAHWATQALVCSSHRGNASAPRRALAIKRTRFGNISFAAFNKVLPPCISQVLIMSTTRSAVGHAAEGARWPARLDIAIERPCAKKREDFSQEGRTQGLRSQREYCFLRAVRAALSMRLSSLNLPCLKRTTAFLQRTASPLLVARNERATTSKWISPCRFSRGIPIECCRLEKCCPCAESYQVG